MEARPTTPLARAQIAVWRWQTALRLLFWLTVLIVPAGGYTGAAHRDGEIGDRAATLIALLLAALPVAALAYAITAPRAWHRAARYDVVGDELMFQRGVMFRTLTIVPLARVQHIDVAQGPIERRHGVARLIVHTAGTGSTEVAVPGLPLAEAEALRDRIRTFIRADLA